VPATYNELLPSPNFIRL